MINQAQNKSVSTERRLKSAVIKFFLALFDVVSRLLFKKSTPYFGTQINDVQFSQPRCTDYTLLMYRLYMPDARPVHHRCKSPTCLMCRTKEVIRSPFLVFSFPLLAIRYSLSACACAPASPLPNTHLL